MKQLKKILEDKVKLEEGILCIGGDFNARIGTERGRWEGEEDENRLRKSKDKIINTEGRELLSLIEEREWEIGNGNAEKDEEEEWTYVGEREESVVDYLLVNQEGQNKIKKFKIGERTESDHQLLELEMKGKGNRTIEEDVEMVKTIKVKRREHRKRKREVDYYKRRNRRRVMRKLERRC